MPGRKAARGRVPGPRRVISRATDGLLFARSRPADASRLAVTPSPRAVRSRAGSELREKVLRFRGEVPLRFLKVGKSFLKNRPLSGIAFLDLLDDLWERHGL